MRTSALTCPACGKDDAVRCKEDRRFLLEGRLTAICFHGNSHPGGRPVVFYADTGEAVRSVELAPHEALYRAAQAGSARGFGAAFLASHCGVYALSLAVVEGLRAPVPSASAMLAAHRHGVPVMAAPMYRGADLVGLEVRALTDAAFRPGDVVPSGARWTKTLGESGIYVANPFVHPSAVLVFEGVWDAIAAAWDAHEHGSLERYAFAAIKAGTSPDLLAHTLGTLFPGVPRLVITDQDAAGQKARARLARVATLAILPGVGTAKDYRAADPARRWEALLEGVERALEERRPSQPSEERGTAKIARRALEGALRAKAEGLQDLEAWRFGQRTAGICRTPSGAKRYYAIRARIHGGLPVAEGQHEFSAVLEHGLLQRVEEDHPDLAAVIHGGPTESPLSVEWTPPTFLSDGRHWSEIPREDRTAYARERGWEPWVGREVGALREGELQEAFGRLSAAYVGVVIPGAPPLETGVRVGVFALATALAALWAEERWRAGDSVGFLPITWFFGGPATGKGTASKLVAMAVSGESRTYGSQRFDGSTEGGWITESVFHLPVAFRDELDTFLARSELEDLKTYCSGEPLQVRKKFQPAATIPPKPVVFSSNAIKINAEDEATRERVVFVQLEPKDKGDRKARNNAFEAFYRWAHEEGGKDLLHRVAVGLYKAFRRVPVGGTTWTRSEVFDAALGFLGERLGLDPGALMFVSEEGKARAIVEHAPWYADLAEYAAGLPAGVRRQDIRAADLWQLSTSAEAERKKLQRWVAGALAAMAGDALQVGGFRVSFLPIQTRPSQRVFRFEAVPPTPSPEV